MLHWRQVPSTPRQQLLSLAVVAGVLAGAACAPAAPPAAAPPAAAPPAAAVASSPAAGAAASAVPAAKPATKELPAALRQGVTQKKIVPFLTAESSPESVKNIQDNIALFEKQNPDIGIELQLMSNDNRAARIINAVAVGEELGIFEIERRQVPDFTQAGYLLPLESIPQSIGLEKFVPGSLLYWPWDGRLYQFTSDVAAAAMYWRKDLFQAAGLAEPDSYERILEASQRLNNQNGVSGNAFETSNNGSVQRFVTFLWQNGGDFYNRDGRLAFDRPGSKQAVEDYAALARFAPPGNASWGSLDPINSFVAGRVAMALFPGRMGYQVATKAPDIAKNTGVREARVARGGKGPRVVYGNATTYAIGATVRYPEEAKKFLQFMFTGDQLLKYSMAVPGHIVPAIKDVQDRVLQQDDPYVKQYSDWIKLHFEATTYLNAEAQNMGSIKEDGTFDKSMVPMPWSSRVMGSPPVVATMLQRITLENMPVEQAYNQAVDAHRQAPNLWKQDNPGWAPPDPNWRPPR
ncbi:MAG: extracellular solute-binding protein [Chloroflexi bacterium]|nr:extracellular solute-binding protein [Chloroflexota bacterium]